jgi:hypothetical protein
MALYAIAALAAGTALCWHINTAAGRLHERLSAFSVLLLMLASAITGIAIGWLASGLTRLMAE